MINIRNATESDLDAVCSMENEWMPSPWSRQGFESELSNSFSHFLVAENENGIAGYAVAWRVAGELQLNRILIHASQRRRGIGRALLKNLARRLTPSPHSRILIEVRSKNLEARSFYSSVGFVETGRRRRYYGGDDAMLMELKIK